MAEHAEDLVESLLSILECPICVEYMQQPIYQCSSGHSICSSCFAKVSQCPVCKASVANPVRNYSLERLSELTAACSNRGCPARLLKTDVHSHMLACSRRTCQCPWAADPDVSCLWTGPRRDRLDHFMDAHRDLVCDAQSNKSFYYDFDKDYAHAVEVLELRNHVFVSYDHYDKQESKCSKVVQYLGPCEDASKFVYEIEFYSEDSSRKLTYTRRVHGEDEDVHTLIETDDCFTMTEQQVKQYLVPKGEGLLFNRWNIKQV